MPRLTDKDYLLRRRFLQELWEYDETQKFYALLTPNKQYSLHSYYATSKQDFNNNDAIEYRSRRDDSSAFSSGKAFNELYRIVVSEAMHAGLACDFDDLKMLTKKIPQLNKMLRDSRMRKVASPKGAKKATSNGVRVFPLVRQEIDVEKLAMALIEIAKEINKTKRQD